MELSPNPNNLESRWSKESLRAENIRKKIAEITPPTEIRGDRALGLHVFYGDDANADIARHIEWTVFEEHFDNDIVVMRDEYELYDESSVFLTIVDYESAMPVGVIRIIKPSEKGLKSMNDLVDPEGPWFKDGDSLKSRFAEIGDDPEHTVDIGTMAVMPNYRSSHAADGASAALYSSCVRWSLESDYNRWVTIVDKKIFEMMQSWGEPFRQFTDTDWASYLDSPLSLPVHTELYSGLQKIKAFDKKMQLEHNADIDIHGLYTKGNGLESVFVLPDFSSVVE